MKMVLLDSRIFVSGADLSGYTSKIEIKEEIEDKSVTNFRSGKAKELLAGLSTTSISGEGQMSEGSASAPGDSFWANRRILEPWSVAPDSASDTSVGTLMYLSAALRTDLTLFDAVGEVAPWSLSARGSQRLARGMSLHPSGTARTATGTGTSVDFLAGPTTGQSVYANLHVLSVAGTSPTLTVAVQSATDSAFTTPNTRATFASANAVSGQAIKISSPGTDRYWRVTWTITGTGGPSFLFLASLGIE